MTEEQMLKGPKMPQGPITKQMIESIQGLATQRSKCNLIAQIAGQIFASATSSRDLRETAPQYLDDYRTESLRQARLIVKEAHE